MSCFSDSRSRAPPYFAFGLPFFFSIPGLGAVLRRASLCVATERAGCRLWAAYVSVRFYDGAGAHHWLRRP